jgi:hypothetical protein
MSLKTFHLIFIIASTLLAFGFGVWEVNQYKTDGATQDLAFGVLSLAAGVGLIFYGRYVFKKLKDISYL